jgi:hypothetical protein
MVSGMVIPFWVVAVVLGKVLARVFLLRQIQS